MVYGPRWEFELADFTVVMRPARLPDDAKDMTRLLEDRVVHEGVTLTHSPSLPEELAHFKLAQTDKHNFHWMIVVRPEGQPEELVGVTSLHKDSQWELNRRLSSGILLANRAWWGKGIASHTHRLRTWYAFATLNATAISSGYLDFNVASGKALASVGYVQIGREWRSCFRNGRWVDLVLLNCFNPMRLEELWPEGNVHPNVRRGVDNTRWALNWAQSVIGPR